MEMLQGQVKKKVDILFMKWCFGAENEKKEK